VSPSHWRPPDPDPGPPRSRLRPGSPCPPVPGLPVPVTVGGMAQDRDVIMASPGQGPVSARPIMTRGCTEATVAMAVTGAGNGRARDSDKKDAAGQGPRAGRDRTVTRQG
jgi:hypothetical protein